MYHLKILTPEVIIFEGQVNSLIAPGGMGYLEVLSNHAPLISTIKPGKVTVTDSGNGKKYYAVSNGFLEVKRNDVALLVDTVRMVSEEDMRLNESAFNKKFALV